MENTLIWYAPSMQWASENNIIMGETETSFAPNDSITREEAAVMVHRLADVKESDIIDNNKLLKSLESPEFTDQAEISTWATDQVDQLRKEHLLLGDTSNTFHPQDNILRSEAAKMLSAYIVFNTKPTIITGTDTPPIEYIEEDNNLTVTEIGEDVDLSFHSDLANSDASLSWKSANNYGNVGTHPDITNQAFYIRMQRGVAGLLYRYLIDTGRNW